MTKGMSPSEALIYLGVGAFFLAGCEAGFILRGQINTLMFIFSCGIFGLLVSCGLVSIGYGLVEFSKEKR